MDFNQHDWQQDGVRRWKCSRCSWVILTDEKPSDTKTAPNHIKGVDSKESYLTCGEIVAWQVMEG